MPAEQPALKLTYDDYVLIPEERLVMLDEDRGLLGAPDLVVEVLSEGNRRQGEIRKRKLYEKYDVQEYWVVDPVLAAVKVYRREGEPFVRAAELAREAGDLLTTPLLPAFEYPLNTLLS